MQVEVYVFEDAAGCESGWTTQDPVEAREYAEKYRLKCIARIFEYSDSELVEDFTKIDQLHSAIAKAERDPPDADTVIIPPLDADSVDSVLNDYDWEIEMQGGGKNGPDY